MLNNISKFLPLRQLRIPAIGLLFTVAMVGEQIKPALSSEVTALPSTTLSTYGEVSSSQTPLLVSLNQKAEKETAIAPKFKVPVNDGIYLFGQSPKPNQVGQGYVLFHKQQGKLVGALYMPNSEFSCFQGTIDKSGELAMTVTGTPDAGASPEVATTSTIPQLSDDEPMSYAYTVTLQDYHPINTISANDRRILQMCRNSQ
ncbi:hypothetical protein [Nostoc sp. MS1]|uniref:hypothetical protein n=1 Tax=Nostoc sp. MS1 TaxID=2764711 RepID=UPI001CC5F069|nr:hypothetical protein [Nostoc sp. MS1]BCL36549.1 hypothetical protein NSMS1_29960 [Nostoc sp. MS1]